MARLQRQTLAEIAVELQLTSWRNYTQNYFALSSFFIFKVRFQDLKFVFLQVFKSLFKFLEC